MNAKIFCQINDGPIDTQLILSYCSDTSSGAQNYFFGSVRKHNHGKKVAAVEYDAAIPLCENILAQISKEAIERWQVNKVIVIHRIGKLSVGEMSVGIGVSSDHRDESYLESRYIIEEIKKRAPIWKKEYYEHGETEWLKGHALCQHTPQAIAYSGG